MSGQDLGATRPTLTDGINRVGESLSCRGANGQALGYFYFEDEPVGARRPTRSRGNEAWRVAANFAECRSLHDRARAL